jgi:hypothetical protein
MATRQQEGQRIVWVNTSQGGEPDVTEDERGSVDVEDVGRAQRSAVGRDGSGEGPALEDLFKRKKHMVYSYRTSIPTEATVAQRNVPII